MFFIFILLDPILVFLNRVYEIIILNINSKMFLDIPFIYFHVFYWNYGTLLIK